MHSTKMDVLLIAALLVMAAADAFAYVIETDHSGVAPSSGQTGRATIGLPSAGGEQMVTLALVGGGGGGVGGKAGSLVGDSTQQNEGAVSSTTTAGTVATSPTLARTNQFPGTGAPGPIPDSPSPPMNDAPPAADSSPPPNAGPGTADEPAVDPCLWPDAGDACTSDEDAVVPDVSDVITLTLTDDVQNPGSDTTTTVLIADVQVQSDHNDSLPTSPGSTVSAQVPEPVSFGLTLLGLAILVWTERRSRRTAFARLRVRAA